MKKKKPWLAALLNIMISGVGYLYVGKRVAFGVLILLSEVSFQAWVMMRPDILTLMINPWVIIGGMLWTIALGIDAYHDAKAANEVSKVSTEAKID
jgi:hypothetical protein